MKETASCPHCGGEVSAEDQFCQHCGLPLASTPAEQPDLGVCARCGRDLEGDERFCLWCGFPVGGPRLMEVGQGHVTEDVSMGPPGGAWDYAAIALLAAIGVISVVSIISTARELLLLARIHGGRSFTRAEALATDGRQQGIARVLLATLVATAFVWLVWQFRAHAALRRRYASVRFTPALGVAWWFVPIANVVMVFKAVRELWVGRPEGDMTPEERRAPVVRWWWATYLLSGLLALGSAVEWYAATKKFPGDREAFFSDFYARDWLFILSRLAQIVAACFAIRILSGVRSQRLVAHR